MRATVSVSRLRRLAAADPPRARSLLVTVLGDALAPRGGRAWLGELIALLAPFGVSERLVRSSVYRLRQDGWLVVEKRGRRSRYRFTPSGQRRFELAHERIYFRRHGAWNGEWTLLLGVAAGPLRRELMWMGFRPLAAGLLAHPAPDRAGLAEVLRRRGAHLHPFTAWGLPHAAGAWNPGPIAAAYRKFVRRFEPWRAALHGRSRPAPEPAFVLRTLLVHAYRRVILHDPRLPEAFLPARWPAAAAFKLCRDLYLRTLPASETYLESVLGTRAETGILRRRFARDEVE